MQYPNVQKIGFKIRNCEILYHMELQFQTEMWLSEFIKIMYGKLHNTMNTKKHNSNNVYHHGPSSAKKKARNYRGNWNVGLARLVWLYNCAHAKWRCEFGCLHRELWFKLLSDFPILQNAYLVRNSGCAKNQPPDSISFPEYQSNW